MSAPAVKPSVSKLLTIKPFGDPYPNKGATIKSQQGYELTFEDGTTGIYPSYAKEFEGPQDPNGNPLSIGLVYAYSPFTSPKGSAMISIISASASTLPTKAEEPVAAKKENPGVPPSMKPTDKKFEDTAKETVKATTIPDNQPRKGVVKVVRNTGDSFQPQGGDKHYKYMVTMEDGASGAIWTPVADEAPLKVGQEINYTYGKVYSDGTKRIDLAPIGSEVDRETSIVRMASVNAAVALVTAIPSLVSADKSPSYVQQMLNIAQEIEQHVTRPLEPK